MKPTLRLWDGYPHTSPGLRDEVTELQGILNKNGLDVSTDGYFGWNTENAVRMYQSSNGLSDDGIVGPRTWAALLDAAPPDIQYFDTSIPMNSDNMRRQLVEAKKYWEDILLAARDAGVHHSVILGIGSRESHWGLITIPSGPTGTGDFIRRKSITKFRTGVLPPDGGGFGRGLMQIDYDAHEFARGEGWKSANKNIEYGGKVLKGNFVVLRNRFPDLGGMSLLRAAVASYNCGAGNVIKAIQKGLGFDYYTHGRDYSKDVLNRAGWFQRNP